MGSHQIPLIWNAFKSSFPQNCHYLTYLLVFCVTPFARMSLFFWYSSPSTKCLPRKFSPKPWIFHPGRYEVLTEFTRKVEILEKPMLEKNGWSSIYRSESRHVYLVVWTNSVSNFDNWMKYFPFNQDLNPLISPAGY